MNKGLHSLCQVISQLNVVGIIFPIFHRRNLGFRTLKQCLPINAVPRGRENQSESQVKLSPKTRLLYSLL